MNHDLNFPDASHASEEASHLEHLFAGANGRLLADLPVRLSVEVGQATMRLGAILQLAAGSIVELDRPADAPVDIKVNGTLIAHGEVVAENGRFAVRLVDIVRSADAGGSGTSSERRL